MKAYRLGSVFIGLLLYCCVVVVNAQKNNELTNDGKIAETPGIFETESNYAESRILRQVEQPALRSEIFKREAGFLSKLYGAKLAELKLEYDKILVHGGIDYIIESFLPDFNAFLDTSKLFSVENFTKSEIREINGLLGLICMVATTDKINRGRFEDFIKQADSLSSQEKYLNARIYYNRALSLKPDDCNAKMQSEDLTDLLICKIEDEKYNKLLVYADNSFNELLYSDAARHYLEALDVKPDEFYPKKRLGIIQDKFQEDSKEILKRDNYNKALMYGEVMFQKQFYEKSRACFEKALVFKPEDKYAKNKVSEVKQVMTELSDKLMYNKLLASANDLQKKGMELEAMNYYFAATEIFPGDLFANQQINKINHNVRQSEKLACLIENADNRFAAKEYDNSRELYLEALEINPKFKYPVSMVKKIDIILAQKNKDEQYNLLLSQAEQLFSSKNYMNAKEKYNEAAKIKQNENYPKEKIREIGGIIKTEEEATLRYAQAVNRANSLFTQKSYKQARNAFAIANSLKPEEKLPSEMIVQIDSLIAVESLLAVKAGAGGIRLSQEGEVSPTSGIEALLEKERNRIPAQKKSTGLNHKPVTVAAGLNFDDRLGAAEIDQELKTIYQQYISRAEKLYAENRYSDARNWYYRALDVDPGESYPQKRIDEINSLFKTQQTSPFEREYHRFIDLADSTFRNHQYALARGWYNRALGVKSNEPYPLNQIREIENKIAENMAAQSGQQFETAMQKAAAALSSKNFNVARFWYKKALELRPENAGVKQRLEEIQEALK